jgi:hypothetical protein
MIAATLITAFAALLVLTTPRQHQGKTPAQIDCERSGKVVLFRRATIKPSRDRKQDEEEHQHLRAELARAVISMQASSARLEIAMRGIQQ